MKRIVVSFLLLISLCSLTFAQQSPMKISGAEKHDITLTDAKMMTQKFQSTMSTDSLRAGLFGRGIIDKILAQPGVKGLRIYNAKKNDGSFTFVIAGVDSTGTDLKGGMLGEDIYPCPPYCGLSSELQK